MKKFFYLVMAVMLNAMIGCQKGDEFINVQNDSMKTFYATFENGAETRTALDSDNNVLWSTGDQISVFAGSTANKSFILKTGENTTYGEFVVNNSLSARTESNGSTSTLSANVAYYPYDSNVTVSEDNGSYTFNATFPAEQTYTASGTFGNGASPMVAVTSNILDVDLKFKNVGAIFRLQLKGEATITKVVFSADANLAGECKITASNSAVPTVEVTSGSNTIELDCGTGVQLNNSTATNFVVAMLPVEGITGGMTITIYDTEGKKMIYTHKKDENITIERSKAYTTTEVNYSGKSYAEMLAEALTADKETISVDLSEDVNLPIALLGDQTSGSGEYKLGGESTQSIIIDLKDKKLNLTTTYWSAIGAVNPDATITIKNGTMTSTGNSAGTWNAFNVRLCNCNYVIEDVKFEKPIALDNAGKSTTIQDVTIEDDGDRYAIWITAEGQSVTVNGLEVETAGRGIKIDEQYVDYPNLVTLSINNSTFTTEEKSAVIVKSVDGAIINWGVDNDISDVAADSRFAVWVDEDSKNYADKVVVNGAYVKVEGSYDAIVTTNEELTTAVTNAAADATIYLDNDIAGDATAVQKENVKVTIEGNNHTYNGVIIVDGKSARYATAGLTIQNVNFRGNDISADAYINLGKSGDDNTRYTSNVTVKSCTFSTTGAENVAIKSYTGGDHNLNVIDCTVNTGMHSMLQLSNVETGLKIADCKVYSKNGINLNYTPSFEMRGCTFETSGYAIRVGVNGSTNTEEKTFTVSNSTLKSDCEEGDAVIIFRQNATYSTLTLNNTTVTGSPKVSGNTEQTTIYGLN